MWDLPRPGLEPVSPALAGRFSTTAPPGKPDPLYFWPCFLLLIDLSRVYMSEAEWMSVALFDWWVMRTGISEFLASLLSLILKTIIFMWFYCISMDPIKTFFPSSFFPPFLLPSSLPSLLILVLHFSSSSSSFPSPSSYFTPFFFSSCGSDLVEDKSYFTNLPNFYSIP